jgi:hypothetical protein
MDVKCFMTLGPDVIGAKTIVKMTDSLNLSHCTSDKGQGILKGEVSLYH